MSEASDVLDAIIMGDQVTIVDTFQSLVRDKAERAVAERYLAVPTQDEGGEVAETE